MVDNDGNNNNRIKIPDATDNGTFGLVNTDNDYPDSRVECQTPKCRYRFLWVKFAFKKQIFVRKNM